MIWNPADSLNLPTAPGTTRHDASFPLCVSGNSAQLMADEDMPIESHRYPLMGFSRDSNSAAQSLVYSPTPSMPNSRSSGELSP